MPKGAETSRVIVARIRNGDPKFMVRRLEIGGLHSEIPTHKKKLTPRASPPSNDRVSSWAETKHGMRCPLGFRFF